MQQDHTGKQVHTAQQQSTNIGALRNNSSPILQTDNNSIKQPKQTGPKKQKTLKQDDLKSKLAVAEAHIAALENTILDNNNLIRNMKLTQLGQNDYHQNGPDLHSYRQTPSSISANCSNCHCSQVDNRIRDLEREMSNLRLQHLENQFFTLRQQSQNLVNLQATAHMNQQGPVHTIHSQHVVQPSPTSVQNHWLQQPVHPLFQQTVPAPPPYMFRQPSRTQMVPSQNIPNSHMQAQHPQMIYHRAAVATQLSPLDSNNSIAVTPSIHPHSQTHHMSSTQGKVQINTSSNKIVPELITKSCVSNDISNSSSGDSKNSFAVTPSTHLHSQIHHMSSTQGKVQINTSTDKNVPEHISNSYSYVPNVLISNSSTGDSKNSFAVRKENGMKANLNVPSQSGPPRDSPKPYPENPDPNTILNSSNSNSKNCFAVEQRSETMISENCSDTVGLPPNKNVQHIYNPFLDKGQTFLLDPDIAAPVTRMI
ncbi:Hypothetical predicted protein [Mytilus galloprovincialis]|nr:Hypothetical predicted protein [Mytilus galloprovincialis]VDI53245.1 Hypothetical predicted protein [Mytilus galloprovincialis]